MTPSRHPPAASPPLTLHCLKRLQMRYVLFSVVLVEMAWATKLGWNVLQDSEQRRALLRNFLPGSRPHFELLVLLAESEGYPADVEAQINEYILTQQARYRRDPSFDATTRCDEIRSYLFRKKLKTVNPHTADLASGDGQLLVQQLKSIFSPSVTHSQPPHSGSSSLGADELVPIPPEDDGGTLPVDVATIEALPLRYARQFQLADFHC